MRMGAHEVVHEVRRTGPALRKSYCHLGNEHPLDLRCRVRSSRMLLVDLGKLGSDEVRPLIRF